jgi:hypothetical protein
MLTYELGSPTGENQIELDDKVYCRILMKMSCTLGWFTPDPRDQRKEFVSLSFDARYYKDTGCLLAIWSVTPDNELHHRSKILNWNGGIEAHLLINNYLNEALEGAARQLGNPKFAMGKYYKVRPLWTPRDEFKPVMEAVLGGTEVVYLPED